MLACCCDYLVVVAHLARLGLEDGRSSHVSQRQTLVI